MNRTKILFNPKARNGEAAACLPQLEALLKVANINYELTLTDTEGDGARLAKEAAGRGFDAVVAVGGDGIASDVAGALIGGRTVYGLIPTGSGDDFAKSLRMSRDLERSVQAIKQGRTKKIDVGLVNGRHYFNSLGLGLDGEVIVEKRKIKGLRDLPLYLTATVKARMRYRGQRMSMDFGDGKIWFEALLVEIMNGRTVGGGYLLTPDSKIDDGLLDFCLIHRLSWLEFFRHVPKSITGKHTHLKQVVMGKTAKVVVESETPLAVQVDGELWPPGERRFEVSVLPGALEAIVGDDNWGK